MLVDLIIEFNKCNQFSVKLFAVSTGVRVVNKVTNEWIATWSFDDALEILSNK